MATDHKTQKVTRINGENGPDSNCFPDLEMVFNNMEISF